MIECVNGQLSTKVVERQFFFVDGFRVNVSRLGSPLCCDPADVPSLGIDAWWWPYVRGRHRRQTARLRVTCWESVPVTVGEARVSNVSHENITDSEATTSAPLSTGDPDITSRDEKDSPVIIAALHECSVCHEQFKTKPTYSSHPFLANGRRIQTAKAGIERKRTAWASFKIIAASNANVVQSHVVWTDEEVSLLLALESEFEGVKFINKAISEHLTNKTRRQIKDKRRTLAVAAQRLDCSWRRNRSQSKLRDRSKIRNSAQVRRTGRLQSI